jgi:hypothetical protein
MLRRERILELFAELNDELCNGGVRRPRARGGAG